MKLFQQDVNDQSHIRLERAYSSLDGLSVGDSLGERFFIPPDLALLAIGDRALPSPPWRYTDDTEMAISIVRCLKRYGRIEQDILAQSFVEFYDSGRGYGPAMHRHLANIRLGQSWKTSGENLFGGQGSFGNGAAMRVAPLGSYFADDLNSVVEQADLSAQVTHSHKEGRAGAIAVAVAAALAWGYRVAQTRPDPIVFLDRVLEHVPVSDVAKGLRNARDLPPGTSIELAVSTLGNGYNVTAQDTVPFALWCAARQIDNYEEAFWLTVAGLGDRDTTCAIVGGVVASYVGRQGIPEEWLRSRERLPTPS